jgi:hypothetical protein
MYRRQVRLAGRQVETARPSFYCLFIALEALRRLFRINLQHLIAINATHTTSHTLLLTSF